MAVGKSAPIVRTELKLWRWNWLSWPTGCSRDTSNKTHATCWGKAYLLKTGPILLCIIENLTSFKLVASRKIYKWSYISGDLRDKGTPIADENSFLVGSARRSTWVSIRGAFTSDSRSSSSTTSGSGSSSDFGLSTSDYGSTSTFAVWLASSFWILSRSSVQISVNDRLSGLGSGLGSGSCLTLGSL